MLFQVKGKKIVGIDPGHQSRGDNGTEPNGPGSTTYKAKVAGGTRGVSTGTPEYKLTLSVAKKLKTELWDRGYQVVNYNAEYLYYILLVRKDYTDPDADKLLTEWTPGMFPNHPLVGRQTVPQPQSDQFLGCCYSIWSDWPDLQSEDEVKARCEASLAAMGARCWQGAETDQ